MTLGIYLLNDVKEASKNNFNNITFTEQYVTECLRQLNAPISDIKFWTKEKDAVSCDIVITIDCSDGFDYLKVKSIYYDFILAGVKFDYDAPDKKVIDFLSAALNTYGMFHPHGELVEQRVYVSIPTLYDDDVPQEHDNNLEYNILYGILKEHFISKLSNLVFPIESTVGVTDYCTIQITFNAASVTECGIFLNECAIAVMDRLNQSISHGWYPTNTTFYGRVKEDGFFNTKDYTTLVATTLNHYCRAKAEVIMLHIDKNFALKSGKNSSLAFKSKRNLK